MGTLEAVGKICRKCGQAFVLTPAEIKKALRKQQREPMYCEKCRHERR